MKARFRVGTRFKAPDGSVATVVSVVTDYAVPAYNLTIVGDPDGQGHGHLMEDELVGFEVSPPGLPDFYPMEG